MVVRVVVVAPVAVVAAWSCYFWRMFPSIRVHRRVVEMIYDAVCSLLTVCKMH